MSKAEMKEELKKLVEELEASRAHTYGSENADHYRGFDAGQRDAAKRIRAILSAHEKDEVVEFEGHVSGDGYWDGFMVSVDIAAEDAWQLPKDGQYVLVRAPRQQKPDDWDENLKLLGLSKQSSVTLTPYIQGGGRG